MTLLRLFKTLLFPLILILAETTYPQTGSVYQISIKDENNGIGQYFDIQIDSVAIVSDTTMNFQMIPNLGIQDSTLRGKYSTFLEMMKRNTGSELEAVLDEDDIIGILDSRNRSWGDSIHVYIGEEFNGTDDLVREVIDELNSSLGIAYFKEVSQLTTKGWNFDYSNVDWKLDRAITRGIQFENDNTPKNCTFLIHGLFEYPNDLKSRLRKQITEVLLLNTSYHSELIKTVGFDEKHFPITTFSNDFVNMLLVLVGLQNGRDFDFDLNEYNKSPIANAGMDKNDNLVGQLITLNGTSSLDPDGNILTYNWKQVFGTKIGLEYMTSNIITLSDSTSPTPSFTPQWPGNYRFKLTVTDDNGFSNADDIDVQVYWNENPISFTGINSFAYYTPGFITTYVADLVEEIADYDKAEWIEFAPYWWMENINSNDLHPLGEWYDGAPGFTIPDSTLVELINVFHSKGLKVFLRPTLEFYSWIDWRGVLQPNDWETWFASYSNFIAHYAQIAEQTGVELFSVGNELKNAEPFTDNWKSIIQTVRSIYSAELTYCDAGLSYYYGNSNVKFWAELDYIGVDFYHSITGAGQFWDTGYPPMIDPPFSTYIQSLENCFNNIILPVQKEYNKPILITESGCRNIDGENMDVGFWQGTNIDNREQAEYYEALLQTISNKDWVSGFFLFVYDLKLDINIVKEDWPISFNPRYRPARDVIKYWYRK